MNISSDHEMQRGRDLNPNGLYAEGEAVIAYQDGTLQSFFTLSQFSFKPILPGMGDYYLS